MEKGISRIRIQNIKGFSNKTFDLELLPNKAHIFVAPNGFGKSSFAIAFKSLLLSKIKIEDNDNYHNADDRRPPQIEIDYCDAANGTRTLYADAGQNQISSFFDICVINSQIAPGATSRNFGGHHSTSTSLEIKPIILVNTIPERRDFSYTMTSLQSQWGANGKILNNIRDILRDKYLMIRISRDIDLDKFSGARISDKIQEIVNEINGITGTKEAIIKKISLSHINDFLGLPSPFDLLLNTISHQLQSNSQIENILTAWQIIKIYQGDKIIFKKIIKYYEYLALKEKYKKTIEDFDNSPWKHPTLIEEKRKLIVKFPRATQISNGQRDILSFVLQLQQARNLFSSQKKMYFNNR